MYIIDMYICIYFYIYYTKYILYSSCFEGAQSPARQIYSNYNTTIQCGKDNDRRMLCILEDDRVKTQTQLRERIGESFLGTLCLS